MNIGKIMDNLKYSQLLKLSMLFKSAKTLYHGTSIDKLESIKNNGLVPNVGKLVSDSYSKYNDYIPPLVFAADKYTILDSFLTMIISIGHFLGKERDQVTDDEIKMYGALIIIKNGEKYFKQRPMINTPEDDLWHETHGRTKYPSVESRDYYSENSVPITFILTGSKLISLLKHFKLWPRRSRTYKSEPSREEKIEIILRNKLKTEKFNRDKIIKNIKSLSDEELDEIMYYEGIK